MGLIAMTPVPASPQASFFASTSAEDSKGELQIIQMDNNTSVGNGHAEANSAASPSTSKSITFQQEFPQRYIKDQRLRDEHGRDGPSDNGRRESMGSSYVNGDYEHGRSQASPPRHTSRSPVVQREPYSPHGHRSPYQPSAASQQPSPPVPATFASIMHAYSASPMSGPGVPEGFHFEHGGSRSKNGSQHGSAT
ncbi:hypothetical protein BC835DRAFT_1383091 [Cytidiella melzeri]|nr:hypothetical protein BC835DRAFT_1383091 [Cytidiella melzeri]